MANNISLVLLVFAFVFAVISIRWAFPPWNFLSLAIAFWIASELFGGLSKVIH